MRRAAVLVLTGLRRALLLGVLAALLLGVGDVTASDQTRLPALEVVVAVDRTTSMAAEDDPAGSRMVAARADVGALAEALPSARFSVVAFGARAEVELPPTTDRVALGAELAALRPEAPTTGAGSALARPVPLLAGVLGGAEDRAAAGPAGSPGPAPRQVLVVLSDGEDTAPGPAGSWAALAGSTDAALVLGYGTPGGGTMPLPDGTGPVTDPATGAPAVSRRDDAALARIADEVGGDYVPRTGAAGAAPTDAATDTAIDAAAGRLRGDAYADLPGAVPGRQAGWVWGALLLLLVLPELRLGWRRWLEGRHETRLGRAARQAVSR